ncbi:TonB-dependent receptor [Zeimonas arvi]|uniref:TonB-dependent receptor n=1 Tax=Zeimonas arvi TaxID=2498847 RepID=A0A5C8NXY8_9BURK|nr:TonB-dependent receptor [Zeimonas arvi]
MSFPYRLALPAATCAALTLFNPLALAQPALEAVVVTATRSDTPVERALADVSVIDAEQIRDAGAATLPELLRSAGGIEMYQNGGPGTVSGLYVRGARNSQTLILVDGIRLENPMSGGGLLEFLPLSAIDRIEVLRAPASSLYGSAAVGGVVQIFTRKPAGDGILPFASVGFGSRGTRQLQAGMSGRSGDTGFALSLSQDRTDGFDATLPGSPDRQVDRDGNRVGALTASLEHRLNADWRVGANLLVSDGRVEYDDAFSTPDTAKMDYRSAALSAFVSGRLMSQWESTLRVGNSSIDYEFAAFTFAPRTDSRTVSWENVVDAAGARWQFGVESLHQKIAGEGLTVGSYIYTRDSRDTDSVFGGWEREFGAHLLRLTLRHDRIEAVGSETSGSIGWGWRLTPNWLLRAGWGSAFRAPTFDDLYNPWSPNPTLRPERSRGIETAAEWRRGGDLFKATAFSNRIRDAIELDNFFVAQNLEVARVRGVTFEGRRRLGEFTLRGSVTFQDPQAERADPVTGITTVSDLARRARRHATLGASWQRGPWRLGADAIAQGERADTNGARMTGYAFVDLWGSYRIDRHWQLFGRLGNVADREYETAAGYRAAPRALFVGVRYDGR